MTQKAPLHVIWWLVSRASGIVALVLISLSVLMGLAMAARAIHRPAIKRAVARLHEHIALIAILAIVIHGLALLGDHWLNPGWRGITVPFALSYRPAFTGLGIIAGYLTVLLGPSFYLRRRLGTKRWRALHRGTVVIWIVAVVHALGAGSDRSKVWMQWIVVAPVVPLVYLLVLRMLPSESRRRRVAPRHDQSAVHGGRTHHLTAERGRAAGRHPAPEEVL
jgi:methionine sulfoxide reductase heme-binding subunit